MEGLEAIMDLVTRRVEEISDEYYRSKLLLSVVRIYSVLNLEKAKMLLEKLVDTLERLCSGVVSRDRLASIVRGIVGVVEKFDIIGGEVILRRLGESLDVCLGLDEISRVMLLTEIARACMRYDSEVSRRLIMKAFDIIESLPLNLNNWMHQSAIIEFVEVFKIFYPEKAREMLVRIIRILIKDAMEGSISKYNFEEILLKMARELSKLLEKLDIENTRYILGTILSVMFHDLLSRDMSYLHTITNLLETFEVKMVEEYLEEAMRIVEERVKDPYSRNMELLNIARAYVNINPDKAVTILEGVIKNLEKMELPKDKIRHILSIINRIASELDQDRALPLLEKTTKVLIKEVGLTEDRATADLQYIVDTIARFKSGKVQAILGEIVEAVKNENLDNIRYEYRDRALRDLIEIAKIVKRYRPEYAKTILGKIEENIDLILDSEEYEEDKVFILIKIANEYVEYNPERVQNILKKISSIIEDLERAGSEKDLCDMMIELAEVYAKFDQEKVKETLIKAAEYIPAKAYYTDSEETTYCLYDIINIAEKVLDRDKRREVLKVVLDEIPADTGYYYEILEDIPERAGVLDKKDIIMRFEEIIKDLREDATLIEEYPEGYFYTLTAIAKACMKLEPKKAEEIIEELLKDVKKIEFTCIKVD